MKLIDKGASKIIQTLATPLGCQSERDDKKLLLKIPQPLVVRYREIKLEMSWKLGVSFLLTSFHKARWYYVGFWGIKGISSKASSCKAYDLQCQPIR